MPVLVERAPAKVNLTLAVLGRRTDGYHLIDSLVAFAGEADRLTLSLNQPLSLKVTGVTAANAGPLDDNLVLKAARNLAEAIPGIRLGQFTLDKRLPVAAGLGGGSSDAAAALRLLARSNRLKLTDKRLLKVAAGVGADVPVCLSPRPQRMRGIGEILSDPLRMPKLPAVLVNPGVAVPTRDVFTALGLTVGALVRRASPARPLPRSREALVERLVDGRNDLEPPAIAIQPVIAEVLVALRDEPGCELARMSGSGATCFGLFTTPRAASVAARGLAKMQPGWWVKATVFG